RRPAGRAAARRRGHDRGTGHRPLLPPPDAAREGRWRHRPPPAAVRTAAAQELRAVGMTVMPSSLSTTDEAFARNRDAYLARVADLHARRARALVGGPEKARRLHKQRGQLLPRERLAAVLDPGSPFLEFGQL